MSALTLVPQLVADWHGGAVVSPCEKYRYHLWRQATKIEPLRRVLFVMLNPSTADGSQDDPTIRKCRGFTERWGFERFDVANLFAWRATDPRELRLAQQRGEDIVGPRNSEWLSALAARASFVVVSWGAHAQPWAGYARKTTELLGDANLSDYLFCLGVSQLGQPRHPLMLAYETERVTFGGER